MKRFLIIDDEPAIGRLIRTVAADCGYDAVATSDPETFMDEVSSNEPEIIAMDLSMPDTDGVELMRFLAAVKCRSKILVVSGFDPRVVETTAALGTAMGLRMSGTLAKPVRAANLRATIRNLNGVSDS